MGMEYILKNNKMILMEAAVVEPFRRSDDIKLHERLMNAPLIYDEAGRKALYKLYQSYIDIAFEAKIPFLVCTPTWRANQSRVIKSEVSRAINTDCVRFMQALRDSQRYTEGIIKIGGMIGCKNDSYKPNYALPASEAERFHSWQIDQLARGGVDFLIAVTLPSVEEAIGIARAMEKTGIPYIISFVISRDGRVLDGTDLNVAIGLVDAETNQKPLGFMVNCAYPTFLCAANQPTELFDRLIGYQANASSLDHCELDGADQVEVEDVSDWGDRMIALNRAYGIKILGGCCGTGAQHLRYIKNGYDVSGDSYKDK